MFEIIMLFAFLYAATCQLLPAKTVMTRPPQSKKNRSSKEKRVAARLSVRKDQATQSLSAKRKSRSHSYADAA
jgi:hypothetical protein